MDSRIIKLTEGITQSFKKDYISEAIGVMIYEKHGKQIEVEFPSIVNLNQWRLTSKGWVGLIKIDEDTVITLNPKFHIRNVLSMMEYAYRLKGFHDLQGLIGCTTLDEFFNNFAAILAKSIHSQSVRGFYKTYELRHERLPYVSGRLMVKDLVYRPWDINIPCEYHDITIDNMDNHILLWTLFTILKSGNLNNITKMVVHKSYMELQKCVTLVQVRYSDCINRSYNSLNSEYRILHSLCRLLLENCGPSYHYGEVSTIPFLINMPKLFEMFVAEWLNINLPDCFDISIQENEVVGERNRINLFIDIVISDTIGGNVKCVIDTKYKDPEKPSNDDIYQILAYTEVKGCKTGILLYPSEIRNPIRYKFGDKDIFIMSFDISKDIEISGEKLLQSLLKVIKYNEN